MSSYAAHWNSCLHGLFIVAVRSRSALLALARGLLGRFVILGLRLGFYRGFRGDLRCGFRLCRDDQ